MQHSDRRSRLKKAAMSGAALICAGLLYGYVLVPMGVMIPCPIRHMTGFLCPGCGVSRMCLALLHFRFLEAAAYNYGLSLSLPFLALLLIRQLSSYIKTGSMRPAPWEKGLGIFLIVFLLAWGVLRNFLGI